MSLAVSIIDELYLPPPRAIQRTVRYTRPTTENMRRAVERFAEILDPTRQKVDNIKILKLATHSYVYI